MDDEDFSSSRADLLTFSTDTVRLDTTLLECADTYRNDVGLQPFRKRYQM